MNEYRVTIDSATEQYVYEVEAESGDEAVKLALPMATEDGYVGGGMWAKAEVL